MITNVRNHFPVAELAKLPTPVTRLSAIGRAFGHDDLFMKRDDLSGPIYGGNKIRKLEFLLGEAREQGRKTVITYGATGSNHALATAVCCREAGLKAVSILAPQEPSAHVRKNLLAGQAVGAELHLCSDFHEFPEKTRQIVTRCQEQDGTEPYIIPAGGTNAVGALGFVHAAVELAEQIQADVIYLPMGTGGTLAGLLAGFLLTERRPRIEAIRVVERAFRNEEHVKELCDELCEKLEIRDRISPAEINIRDEFFGEGYGFPTEESEEAVRLFQDLEGVSLENTYTGKTVAALLADLRAGKLTGKRVLYWNTLNSRDLSEIVGEIGPEKLPVEFRSFFR